MNGMLDRRACGGRGRSAQLLGERSRSTAGEVVAATVGIQSQDPTAAALSIRARSRGLVMADVVAALCDTREVVSTWTLRGTRHWHAAEDVRWLLGLLGPVFNRPGRRAEQLGIAGATGDRAVGALRDALADDGPLTRAQVKERLAAHGVDPSGQAPIHVIRRAALEGVLCVVPTADGGSATPCSTTGFLPRSRSHPRTPPPELVRRYLAAFGPATPADFARWSGLGAPAARAAWESVAGELAEVGGGWVLRDHVGTGRPGRRATRPAPAPRRLRHPRAGLRRPQPARPARPGGRRQRRRGTDPPDGPVGRRGRRHVVGASRESRRSAG